MNIVPTEPGHLETLKTWFPDEHSARQWGGPHFRFPITDATFLEDIRWQQMPAYSLLGETNVLSGFGQYYARHGRCHLARLVIDPEQRSRGIGRQFIHGLMQIGMSDLGVDECSLFVMDSNPDAIRCYTSLQFVPAPYPAEDPLVKNISFMLYTRVRA